MKLPVHVTFRDLVPLPSLEPEIRRRADQVDQWSPDLMSCHVVVESATCCIPEVSAIIRARTAGTASTNDNPSRGRLRAVAVV